MSLIEQLHGEWCNEDVVYRFEGQRLSTCASDDEGALVETNWVLGPGADANSFVGQGSAASGGEQRVFVVEVLDGADLRLLDGQNKVLLRRTYDGDGEEGMNPADTSGTDLGMDLCVVGKKLDPATRVGVSEDAK